VCRNLQSINFIYFFFSRNAGIPRNQKDKSDAAAGTLVCTYAWNEIK
jgi:hypothetical protein